MTIVNDDSSIVNKLEASLTDDARVDIYDRHMFIVQATGASSSWIFSYGLYYKPMTIVNDDCSIVNKHEASLTDDARVDIYDRHMFIVQATGASGSWIFSYGLYYKPMTIVNDDSGIINKLEAYLNDDAKDVIYDCHKFIVQATGASGGWIRTLEQGTLTEGNGSVQLTSLY
jgi:hypothetical protein